MIDRDNEREKEWQIEKEREKEWQRENEREWEREREPVYVCIVSSINKYLNFSFQNLYWVRV